ncbi:MAG: VapC toxin family PIN domain ribonuclease [Acidobacteria bacterium]|nr:VapC toxin family PIN domain ribonuclease [Acidobacteriota bacterium]
MRALLDVNFLIALFDPDHIHNRRANEWWDKNRSLGWASCPITENGAIRILSHPNYSKKMQFSVSQISEVLRDFISSTDHRFWADDVSLCDGSAFDTSRIHGPKQVTDSYLLCLAVRNKGRLVTFDESIVLSSVRGANKTNLLHV